MASSLTSLQVSEITIKPSSQVRKSYELTLKMKKLSELITALNNQWIHRHTF